MNVTGIIAEYNPFHNGHLYHIDQARRLTEADAIVCIMSGNFVQRGEPAIVDKWSRTRMAIQAGADLVIELPTNFALQSAEGFARGAVGILDSIGLVKNLVFGSETGKVEPLHVFAEFLLNETDSFRARLQLELKKGVTFPVARMNALSGNCGTKTLESTLKNPNNILGIEYVKSLLKIKSKIKPITIKRIESGYHYPNLKKVPSATAVRNHIKTMGLSNSLKLALPGFSFNILEKEFSRGKGPVFTDDFSQFILGDLRLKSPKDLTGLSDISEGLENRILQEARSCGDIRELLYRIKTKRYTLTRIQRLIWQNVFRLTKELAVYEPQYVRVLGFSERKGKQLLKLMKSTSKLPIIIKPAYYTKLNENAIKLIEIDFLASDIYCLAYKKSSLRRAGSDFLTSVYIGCKDPFLR
jgi:predicted nucleotidyltransferase